MELENIAAGINMQVWLALAALVQLVSFSEPREENKKLLISIRNM